MLTSTTNITNAVMPRQGVITNKEIKNVTTTGYTRGIMKNRIKELREAKGWSQYALADRLNSTAQQVGRLENNKRRLSDFWMVRLAEALGCDPAELITNNDYKNSVPIIATVGAGGEVYPIDDLPLMKEGVSEHHREYINCEFVDAPPGTYPAGVVAVRIKGDSMMPFMPSGTIVYYEQRITGDCSEHINKLCVVQTADGAAMLKIVERGSDYGKYNLRSYNMSLIENVQLEWCARVIFIKPV